MIFFVIFGYIACFDGSSTWVVMAVIFVPDYALNSAKKMSISASAVNSGQTRGKDVGFRAQILH